MSYELKGLKNVQKNFEKELKKIKNVSDRELREIADDLLTKSVNIAPLDTGELRDSGKVTENKTNNSTSYFVSYNTIYAIQQHEELDYHHEEGQAKYLEQPFNENIRNYINKLKQGVKVK